jgi:hypothetical protein
VAVDAADEAIDNARGVVVVGVDQQQAERPLAALAERIGITHLAADDVGEPGERPFIRSQHQPLPLAPRFHDDQRYEVLSPDRSFQLRLEHGLEQRVVENTRALRS